MPAVSHRDNGREMETTIMGLHRIEGLGRQWKLLYSILRLYGDNGQENGDYH